MIQVNPRGKKTKFSSSFYTHFREGINNKYEVQFKVRTTPRGYKRTLRWSRTRFPTLSRYGHRPSLGLCTGPYWTICWTILDHIEPYTGPYTGPYTARLCRYCMAIGLERVTWVLWISSLSLLVSDFLLIEPHIFNQYCYKKGYR